MSMLLTVRLTKHYVTPEEAIISARDLASKYSTETGYTWHVVKVDLEDEPGLTVNALPRLTGEVVFEARYR